MLPEQWIEVHRVLRSVLGKQPGERSAAIAEACQGDEQLRIDVESLLLHEIPAETFLEQPTVRGGLAGQEIIAGARVGPYRLERKLGEGGMGVVWLAERADGQYRQTVAVKLVKAGMDGEEILSRFRIERQVLAGLEHAHIAHLLDGGVLDGGRPYLVMEYVEGSPIVSYCDAHQLTLKKRLELFRKVCGAVQYAHRNLVVHRDLKPSNILVTADGEPKLLDFGIARLLDPHSNQDESIRTWIGQRWLTPRYASPEQVRGESITTASDVYSLGVILYELLTGQEPYALTTSLRAEYEHAICNHEPLRPSAAIARATAASESGEGMHRTPQPPSATRGGNHTRLQRRLRGDLDAIILTALHKEPGSRYSSAEQLSLELERHMRGLPVLARGNAFWYPVTKFARRHVLGLVCVLTLFALLLGGMVATARQAQIAARERNLAMEAGDRARKSADSAHLEARKAERVTSFLQSVLSSANPRVAKRGISAEEALDRAAATVSQAFGQDPEVEAAIHDAIGVTYLDLGRYAEAEQHLSAAVAITERIQNGDSLALAGSLRSLGRLAYAKQDFDAARRTTERALAIDRRLHDGFHESTAVDLNNLAAIARAMNDYDQAAQCIEEALAMRRALFGEEHYSVAESLNIKGGLLRARGDLAGAEALTRRALEIRRRLHGDSHPDTAQELDNLGMLLSWQDDFAAAEPLVTEAVAQFRESLGEDHPQLAVSLVNLGAIMSRLGNPAEAESKFREALQIRRRTLPEGDERTARAAQHLCRCLVELQRYEEAELVLREAIEETRRTPGKHYPSTVMLIRQLVQFYDASGQPQLAAKWRAQLPPE